MTKVVIENKDYVTVRFELELHSNCIQIFGDAGVGKSYFYQCAFKSPEFLCFNYTSVKVKNGLVAMLRKYVKDKKIKYVLLDNADLLMTEQLNDFIASHEHNWHFILIGRGAYTCVRSLSSMCTLEKEQIDEQHYLFHLEYF